MNTAAAGKVDFAGTDFLQTSTTNVSAQRLNWRAEVLLARHPEAVVNKRVLDLASHDGRFTYAALACGARQVTGVEGRASHVSNAYRNLKSLGCDSRRYQFQNSDLIEFLRDAKPGEFDTILCFGIFSHLIEQVEVLREVRRVAPEHFILDAWMARERRDFRERLRNYRVNRHVAATQLGEKPGRGMWQGLRERWRVLTSDPAYRTGSLIFLYENSEAEGATIRHSGLMAWATPSLVEMLFDHYGFQHEEIDWGTQRISDWAHLQDYATGDRKSWLARLPRG